MKPKPKCVQTTIIWSLFSPNSGLIKSQGPDSVNVRLNAATILSSFQHPITTSVCVCVCARAYWAFLEQCKLVFVSRLAAHFSSCCSLWWGYGCPAFLPPDGHFLLLQHFQNSKPHNPHAQLHDKRGCSQCNHKSVGLRPSKLLHQMNCAARAALKLRRLCAHCTLAVKQSDKQESRTA